ncbi:hypothetical protein TWF481_003567 [Arthrobotrys musiformis]|uniref:Uncharacterized protein n=1 Tax=Arthrobotrys musiformis TaxID=47236 RepID=A0AAV9WGY9_9PEZI
MCERTHLVYACGHTVFHSRTSCKPQVESKETPVAEGSVEVFCSEYQEEIEIPEEKDCGSCIQARALVDLEKLKLEALVIVEEVEIEVEVEC